MIEKSEEEREYEVRLEENLAHARSVTRYYSAAGLSVIALILAFVTFNVVAIKLLLLWMAILRAYGWGSLGHKYDLFSFFGYGGILVYFIINHP